jgi:hypothetical protein
MASDPIRERYDAFFAAEFMPIIRYQQSQGADERMAYAEEYSARQLGQINQKLGRLIEILERNAGAAPGIAEPVAVADQAA